MKTTLTNIAHAVVSVVLMVLPVIIQQHASWQNVTLGTILVSIQHYFIQRYTVAQVKAGALK